MKKQGAKIGAEKLESVKDPFFLWVQVKPRSSADAILGWDEKGFLLIQLKALPQRGAANESCRQVLSRALKIPRARILLEKGHVSRRKKFRIQGMTRKDGELLLAARLSPENRGGQKGGG